jgi:hypothetical protein
MKTILSHKTFMLFAFASIIIVSCKKESDSINPVAKPPVTQPSVASIGSIVDVGTVNTDTRIMKIGFNSQNYTLYSPSEDVSYVSAKVNVAFYVNNDGLIPSGEYSFTNSDTKSPFTFDSGVFTLNYGSDSYSTQSDQIVDGKIIVTQVGDKYQFSLQVNLASGMTSSQILNGSVDYADSK